MACWQNATLNASLTTLRKCFKGFLVYVFLASGLPGDTADGEKKLQLDLQSLDSKGIQLHMDLKGAGNASAKKAPSSRGKRCSETKDKKGERVSGAAAKRKR